MNKLKTIFLFAFLGAALGIHAQTETFIYVCDATGKIIKYDADGANPEVFIEEGLIWPQDILFLETEGVVLISDLTQQRITKHDAETGEFLEIFAVIAGGPTRMKIGPDDLIYVIQWNVPNTGTLRYQLDGTPLGPYTNAAVATAIGMDWDSEGNLYIASFGSSKVHRFNDQGTYTGEFINTNLNGPTNILFDDDDHLLVLNWLGGTAELFDSDGNHLGTYNDDLPTTEGIFPLPNGNRIIGVGGRSSVEEYDPDGEFVRTVIESGEGGLTTPNAVVVRETQLSIQENTFSEMFVIPTVGEQFVIKESILAEYNSIELFDVAGKRVLKVDNTQSNILELHSLREGLYFFKGIHASSGRIAHQKIMVRRTNR
ncbi:MAG: T9SS type A sorting domain-containing protein [Flavobacteriaceae bacterium]|nr:T9SS type A sorting domain-containing protein [Flavobacteriaceae bacterium]